jgi:dTDP-4-amino-4,6-dideoxygalactose transaminase
MTSDGVRPAASLALFGSEPAFDRPLHVGRPNIGDRERLRERIEDILDRRWLTNFGPYEQLFGEALREITGTRHCVPIDNGTRALEILVRAMDLKGQVIVPAFTFVATAHVLTWLGLEPVFADVDPDTHNLDPARVEELITERTSAILGVHLWGTPCDTEALGDIAARHELKLFFDAAHAFGCTRGGVAVGGFGDAEAFSFHGTKFVNSFEGGAIATNDDALAERVRRMMNFGFVDYDEVESVGINGKLSEPAAAMGLTSLESMAAFVAVNRRNRAAYREALGGIRGIELFEPPVEQGNFQYVVILVDPAVAGLDREHLKIALEAENVLARRYFSPGCHRMAPYRDRAESIAPRLPVTERLARQVLCLPTGTEVDPAAIARIGAIIRTAVDRADEVVAHCRREVR